MSPAVHLLHLCHQVACAIAGLLPQSYLRATGLCSGGRDTTRYVLSDGLSLWCPTHFGILNAVQK